MNAVEIEEAISALAEQTFDAPEFAFAFLLAFGNKETTLRRLRKGESNKSNLGGVLQTNNIHIAVAAPGEVTKTLAALKARPATARGKAKFVLATDGETFEAEDLSSGETVACAYRDFPDHFGFFLPLAGITTVQQLRESSFDIRATSRLNRLYVELLKDNLEWGTEKRRPDMNHFMARLIICFFAEDTDIFAGGRLFTSTIERMSARDSSNTHEVIQTIFLALNFKQKDRKGASVPRWADDFPYVNGGLFSGSLDVPRFSKIARSYLLHIGNLDWTRINPDIFGSMIQAVAEDEERGALGMHYQCPEHPEGAQSSFPGRPPGAARRSREQCPNAAESPQAHVAYPGLRCENFEEFKPMFIQVKKELDTGIRQTRPFQTMAEIEKGHWFVVGGQIAYVADVGDEFVTEYDRRGSNQLKRSFLTWVLTQTVDRRGAVSEGVGATISNGSRTREAIAAGIRQPAGIISRRTTTREGTAEHSLVRVECRAQGGRGSAMTRGGEIPVFLSVMSRKITELRRRSCVKPKFMSPLLGARAQSAPAPERYPQVKAQNLYTRFLWHSQVYLALWLSQATVRSSCRRLA